MSQKNKKICLDVISRYFFPVMAGIENNIANVYGYMDKKRWDIKLHTSNRIPQKPDILPTQDLIRGIQVLRYDWHAFGCWPKINWQTTDAVCLHNFDIFPHSLILVYVLFRKLTGQKVPKIFLTPHGGFTPGWETFPLLQRYLKKFYQATLGCWLINHVVDGFRSVSQWEADESIKHGIRPEKIQVITNGIEDEAYQDIDSLASKKIKSLVKKHTPYLLQIGRIHPIKNQATAIRSLAKVPKAIKLLLVGPVTDNDYFQQLTNLIKELHLESRVFFLGVIEGIDKYYLLRNCLAYVHMALWESYCNTVHESMSQKCVCIISRGTALEELIRDNFSGFAVPVFSGDEVAAKINFILSPQNRKYISKIKANAFKYTQGHSWQAISTQVQNMYLKYLNLPL